MLGLICTKQKQPDLSQETLKKIKNEDTNISAKSLNSLCLILDMQPKDIFIYEETAEDLEQKNKI